jgi:hypothetical protein
MVAVMRQNRVRCISLCAWYALPCPAISIEQKARLQELHLPLNYKLSICEQWIVHAITVAGGHQPNSWNTVLPTIMKAKVLKYCESLFPVMALSLIQPFGI